MDAVAAAVKKWPRMAVGVGVQLAAAAVIILAVYYASLYVSNSDELVTLEAVPHQRQSVMVLQASMKTSGSDALTFVTTDSAHMYNTVDSYICLPPSLNSRGGAQFTYTFWLQLSKNYSNFERTLFLRGDTTVATFQSTVPNSGATRATISHPVAMCPMVRVKAEGGRVSIFAHFNSADEFNNVARFDIQNGSVFDMTQKHLITVALHEGGSYGEINGTTCKIFVDQMVEQRTFQGATLKENTGNLFVLPKFKHGDAVLGGDRFPVESVDAEMGVATMQGLMYHNYAFDLEDVHSLMGQQSNSKNVPYTPATNKVDFTDRMAYLQTSLG